jgi:hypothetical protein
MKTVSKFRNWHKTITNCRKKELCNIFPISVSGSKQRINITIREMGGKILDIELNEENTQMVFMHIDRILNPEKYVTER